MNNFYLNGFLVPSLLVLPVETLSSMISLLIKPKVLLQIKNELDQKTGNVSIDLEYWSIPGKYQLLEIPNSHLNRSSSKPINVFLGCHELMLSLGLDVVEITDDKVLLFGGKEEINREFHQCLSQILAQT